MKRKSLLLMLLMALSWPLAVSGQTYFTQTTTSDFMKGYGLNVTIADDCVSLQCKMASVADWNATTNLPQTLEGHQVVLWRNYIYCVGGFNGSNPVNSVYRSTQQSNGISGWSGLNGLPVALRDMGVAATQTQLVVIGGRNNDTVSDKIYSAKFNDDGSIGAWSELPFTLPQACWGLRAVEAMGSIYVIGGANTDSDNDATDKVYRLKVNAIGEISGIVEVNNLPAARNGHAVTVYDSKIIVTGGYDATHTAQNTVYSATINLTGASALGKQRLLTEAVYNHTTLCANGIITVIGGHNGSLPSNKFYYANADASTYSWTMSDVMLPERYSQSASFAFGDKIFLCGGEAISGTINNLVQYMAVTTSTTPVKKSAFVGIPYYIGTPKTMQELNYTLTNPTSKSYEILYRTAEENMNYGNWTSAGSDLPAVVNQSKSYIQYMFRVSATGANDFSIDDVTLTVAGYNQLEGNLNDMGDLTVANSPYLVTSDISFTSGTHNIEPGVTIMFMPNTGMSIGQASVNFNGTQSSPILLTAYEASAGSWNGVYFQDASDNGVTSMMNYTTIEKAGNGSNAANLRLYYTNQPSMNHCTFKNSIGDGAYFQNSSPTLTYCTFSESPDNRSGLALINSSPVLTSCTISNNSYQGLHLNNSAPTCNNCTMTGNMYGIYFQTTNFDATFSGVACSNNQFGMFYCSPNRSFNLGSSEIVFANNTADIAIAGGQISSNQTWNNYPNCYALLGNVEVYGGTPKLTVQAGATIKGNTGCGLYVGRNSNQGGMLYAVGTAAAPITFTSLNGEVGGWDGVRFRDGSDYSSSSSMRYCTVEKGTTNLVCENTNQPSTMWCTLQDAQNEDVYLNNANISIEGSTIKNAKKGIYVNSSSPTLVSVVFDNLSEACVWHNNACNPTYSDCTMSNSHIGIRYETCNRDFVNDDYNNITFQNNTANIGVPGGDISVNHTWDSNSYGILGSIRVGGSESEVRRLTLTAGSTLKFAEGTNMQISYYIGYWSYNEHYDKGELVAVGTAEQPIIFTSLNGEVGGWNGICFTYGSDHLTGQQSVMQHCIVENGNEYNLHLSSTNQPSVIENCTFQNSNGYGLYFYNCGDWVTMSDCQFQNNGNYGLYFNSAYYVHDFENLTFTGNLYDAIAMGGGDITDSRTWSLYDYHILGSIRVGGSESEVRRLTLTAGSTLKFAEGTNMQISYYIGYWSYNEHYDKGELVAVGTAEQPIIFTSLNGEVGGWNGICFTYGSDHLTGQQSVMQHCIVENGNEYNLHLSSTNQPSVIENCTFQNSNGYGLYFYNCGDWVTMSDCQFQNNGNYGLYFNSAYYVHDFENLTFTGNLYDAIAMGGGDITDSRTWSLYDYHILGSIRVGGSESEVRRLTLTAGSTLKFAEGTNMQISYYIGYWSYNEHYDKGELVAVGTAEQPIIFTSLNGEVGGWNGICFTYGSDHLTGQQSVMQHCIVENGNEYNLHLSSTNQPSVIENCTFQNSNGYGLYFYNASPNVSKCVIKNNASHGIYLNSNAHPVVGGAAENANSIYGNGGYQAYQDGGQNVNMSYNFWGQPGYRQVEDEFIYDKLDDPSKGRITVNPTCWFPMENFSHLQGAFIYGDNRPMSNREMNIISATDSIMATATTNGNGQYDFSNYQVSVYNTLDPDFGIDILAGVNATDALLVMRHYVHLDTLTGSFAAAADVNLSGNINGTDAMLIMRRAVDEEFPSGDFYYYSPSGMSITGENVEYDLSFLCYGDVNGSYTPATRDNSIELLHEGQLMAESYQEMELPVSLKQAIELGALTLNFVYPEEYIEIEDVTLAATGESLLFTAKEGELRIVWFSLEPLALAENDELLVIKVRTKNLSFIDEPVAFSMGAYSELANGSAQVLEDVVIAMPDIVTQTMGMSENDTNNSEALSLYPNPANDICTMVYQLPEAGRVTVSVYNLLGVKVLDVANFNQEGGQHELRLSTASLAVGMYSCRITFEGESSWVKTTMLIIEK